MTRIALVALIFSTALRAVAVVSVGQLRCEHLENPQGIDAAAAALELAACIQRA